MRTADIRRLIPILVLCSVFTPLAACRADVPPDTLPHITEAWRQQDGRLQRRVTLVSPRISIGEMVEELAQQSGVDISVKDDTGAGDPEVTTALQNVPVADAMDALWSLVSYQNAEWEWRRSGEAGHYRYRLARSDSARALASAMKAQIQADVEKQAKSLEDALKLSPDELKQAAEQDELVRSLIDDGRVRPSISLFAALPPDLQTALLRGQQSFSMPVSQLSPQMQEYVQELWRQQQALTDRAFQRHPEYAAQGLRASVPPPTSLSIVGHPSPLCGMPEILVDAGYGSGNIVGGLWEDRALRRKITALWMLPGDSADDAALARTVQAARPNGGPDPRHPFHSRILELAKAASLSVIARLPDETQTRFSAGDARPDGRTVGAYLDFWQKILNFQHKWRGGVLLVTNPAWFVLDDDSVRVPWSAVRHLREQEAANGRLTLDDLAWAAGQLNDVQLRRLAERMPVMESAARWHDLLAFYQQEAGARPYLRSAQGSSRRAILETVAPQLGLNLDGLYQRGMMPHTRISEKGTTVAGAPGREITISVTDQNGRLLASQAFRYSNHQWRPSVDSSAPPGAESAGQT